MSELLSRFAKWLVERGARVLAEDRERYAEQWLADLVDRPTAWAKLAFAFGVWRSSGRLRLVLENARMECLFSNDDDDAAMSTSRVAAMWVLQMRDSSRLSAEEQARLVQWLRQSPEHLIALLQTIRMERWLRRIEMRSHIRGNSKDRRRRTLFYE